MSPITTAPTAPTASTASPTVAHPGRHSILAAGQEANHLPDPFPTFNILTDPAATLQERAVVMSTRGMRSSQIALALGVPPRTVRHWLARFRKHMAAERQAELAESLDQAIESYRAILVAAWESYESEQRIERAILTGQLDRTRRRRIIQSPRRSHRTAPDDLTDLDDRDAATDTEASETILEETETPRRTNHGARYLSIALAAQREITRLQGLYDRDRRPPADIRLTVVERPATPDDQPPSPAPSQPASASEPASSAPSPVPAPSPSPAAASVVPQPFATSPISQTDHAASQPYLPPYPMRSPSTASPLSPQGEGLGVRIPLPPLPPFRHHPPLNPASFPAYRL
jgi:Homeodomain-like domain-containing protein